MVFWRIVNITVAVWTGCRLKCWLMVQNQEKDFMQKIFNIEHVFAPQFSYGKNMYTVQLALLLSWCCKDDDPNDYCIVTSLLQGRWISGDDARNHKREGGGIVNCSQCTIQLKAQMPKHVFELTLNWTSKASVRICLGRQSCHRHGPKTVPAQTTVIISFSLFPFDFKPKVLVVMLFLWWKINSEHFDV